ncbi:DUF4410 domain-containing protein [Pyruvatibacter mobilis]|uniref:DUF4410 domain-containing protein n=1 Tax=Pyruvatibacter mobilis TaxID=1712261 RepID=UPI003BA8B57A
MIVACKPAILRLGILFLALFVAACSSSGTLQKVQSSGVSIKPNSVAALNVTSPSDADSLEAAEELRSRLFGSLVSQGLFEQVVPPSKPADYELTVALSGISEVSQGARIFFGVLAGSNKLTADVKLRDSTDDSVVRAFVVGGESAAHPLSSENDMGDAIREASSRIIQALR